jgi:diacylglycerol kinase (ATP)
MNNAGIGIDAEVARQFKASKTRGIHTYVKLAFRNFVGFKGFSVKLVVDDKRVYVLDDLMFIDITNGSQWGAGAKIAPLSTISDGYLEAIIFERATLINIPRLFKLFVQGKLYRHPNVRMVRGKKFEITRRVAGNAHVDGEAVKLGKRIEALVREKSMRLLVPKRTELV